MERLEDSLLQLGSMATNRYAAPFRPEVTGWVARLSTVSEVIDHWLLVQNMWMYMEAVFRCRGLGRAEGGGVLVQFGWREAGHGCGLRCGVGLEAQAVHGGCCSGGMK